MSTNSCASSVVIWCFKPLSVSVRRVGSLGTVSITNCWVDLTSGFGDISISAVIDCSSAEGKITDLGFFYSRDYIVTFSSWLILPSAAMWFQNESHPSIFPSSAFICRLQVFLNVASALLYGLLLFLSDPRIFSLCISRFLSSMRWSVTLQS